MTTSQKGRPAPKAPPAAPPKRRVPVVAIAIGVVVLVAAIAIVASSLSGGSGKKTTAAKSTEADLQATRPVTFDGTPLPAFDESAKVDAAVGRPAPTVHGQGFDGTPITITNDGSPKLVLFVAHWCPHCGREVPLLAQWLRTNHPPAGVKIVTVSTGVNPNAPNFPPYEWLASDQWTQPTIADDARGTAAAAFGLPSYPYFVVLDASGKVVTRTSGELPIDEFQSLLNRAATGTSA